jgi:uncharacterized Zn finger protein
MKSPKILCPACGSEEVTVIRLDSVTHLCQCQECHGLFLENVRLAAAV